MGDEAESGPVTGTGETTVREFRQILTWPVQIAPVQGRVEAAAHWERLLAVDCNWQAVADELTDAGRGFQPRHYAEFVAFMPDVQRFLYGEGATGDRREGYGASPIRIFRRNDIATIRVKLGPGQPSIDFRVARIELYFFYDIDLAILAVEVVGRDLTLAQAEDMLFRLGRAYPTSWDQDGGGAHCCAQVSLLGADGRSVATSDYEQRDRYFAFVREQRAPCIAAHWAYLLHPLTFQRGGDADVIPCRQLEHQRIPVLGYLAVDDPYAISRQDWMRLALASPSGAPGAAPFAPGFLGDFEARYCYDRFWDPVGGHDQTTTRILCSGHAFVMVGEAGNAAFTDAEHGILAQFRHQYFLLGLIAHFHRAALLIFRDRLVSAISLLRDYAVPTVRMFRREIRQTHENFLRFTHRYWFQEVSNQAPARDIFHQWTALLGTDWLFREVREEVRDMVEYLDSDGLRRQANSVVRLTVVTFFGLIGTVATGFLGMNLFDLTRMPALGKLAVFIVVAVPVAALTFYTAAKSQRLAEFLESVSDERRTARDKLRALGRVWQRRK